MSKSSSLPRIAHWPGRSGRTYTYRVHPIDAAFEVTLDAAPGQGPSHYVFAREVRPGSFVPVAMGEVDGPSERRAFEAALAQSVARGATHVHVRRTPTGDADRSAEAADLAGRWPLAFAGALAGMPEA